MSLPVDTASTNRDGMHDIHICGACKLQFDSLDNFLLHKKQPCCTLPSSEASTSETQIGDEIVTVSNNVDEPRRCRTAGNVAEECPETDRCSPHSDVAILCEVDLPADASIANTFALPTASTASLYPRASASNKSSSKKRFQCEVPNCPYSSSYLKDLLRHMRTHTGERPFLCRTCGKSFNRSDKLKVHLRYHTGDKPYKCKECNYATSDSSSLKKHLRVHSDERPFKCQICPYASRNSSQLVVHLRTHTGDAPFHCSICNTKFKINSDLKRHLRMHTGEKPYSCQLCDYKCAIKGNLKTHMRLNHSAENVQKCSQCDFVTPSRKVLREHEKSHDVKAIKCPQCPYFCTSRTALRNHTRVHSDERPFKCDFCNYASRQPGNVRTHVKKHHPEKLQRYKKSIRKPIVNPAAGGASDEIIAIIRKQRSRPMCVKTYRCNYCEAAFVRQDSLRSHLRQHQDRLKLEGTRYTVVQLSTPLVTQLGNSEVELIGPLPVPSTVQSSSSSVSSTMTVSGTAASEPQTLVVSSDGLATAVQVATTVHSRMIEQALQQSGVMLSGDAVVESGDGLRSTVGTSLSSQSTQQFIAYIQNNRNASREDNLQNAAILATLNLKPNTGVAGTSQIVTLDQQQAMTESEGEIGVNAGHQSLSPSALCNLETAPVMYQLQPGVGFVPILPVGAQLLQNEAEAGSSSTSGEHTTNSNIQYVVQASSDMFVNRMSPGTSAALLSPKAEQVYQPSQPFAALLPDTAAADAKTTTYVQLVRAGNEEVTEEEDVVGRCQTSRSSGSGGGSEGHQLLTSLTSSLGTLLQPVVVTSHSSQQKSHDLPEPIFATPMTTTAMTTLAQDKATSTVHDIILELETEQQNDEEQNGLPAAGGTD